MLFPRIFAAIALRAECAAGLALCLAIGATPSFADQTQIPDYREAREIFWQKLYPSGGWTLYCGERFEGRSRELNVEHIYPASWMAKHLGCGSRRECQRTRERFNRMEADLHNLYPALASINRARSNYVFGEIPGEPREFGDCDFERDRVERRPTLRLRRHPDSRTFPWGASPGKPPRRGPPEGRVAPWPSCPGRRV